MNKEVIKWKVADLKPHPRQAQFFDQLPFHLIRDLAQDIKARGLKEPLEILPDGTIVLARIGMFFNTFLTTVRNYFSLSESVSDCKFHDAGKKSRHVSGC